MTYQTLLHCRLLAAELRGAPWPEDIFDPAGRPLRRVVRGGQTIGAYTLGLAGRDAAGRRPDNRYYPLYGPLDLPKPVTSPAAP